MHPKATAWDKANGVDTSFASGNKWPAGKQIPSGRPCDICGKSVDRGFIHKECIEKERDKFLDLM
jgi:hypothetical protein